jgi:hypothetical protein
MNELYYIKQALLGLEDFTKNSEKYKNSDTKFSEHRTSQEMLAGEVSTAEDLHKPARHSPPLLG